MLYTSGITNAQNAREMADKYDPAKDPKLDRIMARINDRANNGYYSTLIDNISIPTALAVYLVGLGYMVMGTLHGDLSISWKDTLKNVRYDT